MDFGYTTAFLGDLPSLVAVIVICVLACMACGALGCFALLFRRIRKNRHRNSSSTDLEHLSKHKKQLMDKTN